MSIWGNPAIIGSRALHSSSETTFDYGVLLNDGDLSFSADASSEVTVYHYLVNFYDDEGVLLHSEYVLPGEDCAYGEDGSWALTLGGEAVPNITKNVQSDMNLYSTVPVSGLVVYKTGSGRTSASASIDAASTYQLLVIALNSEASTYSLNISAQLNGVTLAGEQVAYTSYQSSGTNRRNSRVMRFELEAAAGDQLAITVTSANSHTSLVYMLYAVSYTTFSKMLSSVDAVCSGSNTEGGMVVYGTFNNNNGGTINAEVYIANTPITTANPGSSYTSAYILWFT